MDINLIITICVVLAVILALYVLIKAGRKKISTRDQKYIQKHWEHIEDEKNKNPNSAILEADKLLGHVLKLLGYEGSLGEMLKKSESLFKNINDVWEAHKLRNRIAHEMGIKISEKETKSALRKFKSALNDLGAKL